MPCLSRVAALRRATLLSVLTLRSLEVPCDGWGNPGYNFLGSETVGRIGWAKLYGVIEVRCAYYHPQQQNTVLLNGPKDRWIDGATNTNMRFVVQVQKCWVYLNKNYISNHWTRPPKKSRVCQIVEKGLRSTRELRISILKNAYWYW